MASIFFIRLFRPIFHYLNNQAQCKVLNYKHKHLFFCNTFFDAGSKNVQSKSSC